MDSETLAAELTSLLNRHSIENGSDTPDFLLADYLLNCLDAYERITQGRDAWYGMNPQPGVEWAGNVPETPRLRARTGEANSE